MDNNIVTIDLGTRNISITVAREEGNRMEVAYYNVFPSAGVRHGKIQNLAQLGKCLKEALSSVEDYLGIRITEIVVNSQKCDIRCEEAGVSTSLPSSRTVQKEDLERLEDLARDKVQSRLDDSEEVLSVLPQSFNTDDEIGLTFANVIGSVTENLSGTFKTFVVKKNSSSAIEQLRQQLGLRNIRQCFAPENMGESCLTPNEKELGVALIDFGAGATSVSIYYDNVLRHYAAIPFGGDSITADIRYLCSISSDNLAENIKKAYGGCMPTRLQSLGEKTLRIKEAHSDAKIEVTAKFLSEIITARTREILEAMLWEIQQSGYADKIAKNGIVFCGGSSSLLNLCLFTKDLSGYNARIAAPTTAVFSSGQASFFNPDAVTSGAIILSLPDFGVNCTEEMKEVVEEPKPAPEPEPEAAPEPEPRREPEPAPAPPVKDNKVAKGKKNKPARGDDGPGLFDMIGDALKEGVNMLHKGIMGESEAPEDNV